MTENDRAYYEALDEMDAIGVITYPSHTVADMRPDPLRDVGGEA